MIPNNIAVHCRTREEIIDSLYLIESLCPNVSWHMTDQKPTALLFKNTNFAYLFIDNDYLSWDDDPRENRTAKCLTASEFLSTYGGKTGGDANLTTPIIKPLTTETMIELLRQSFKEAEEEVYGKDGYSPLGDRFFSAFKVKSIEHFRNAPLDTPSSSEFNGDIDTIGKCANCRVEFHIHKPVTSASPSAEKEAVEELPADFDEFLKWTFDKYSLSGNQKWYEAGDFEKEYPYSTKFLYRKFKEEQQKQK